MNGLESNKSQRQYKSNKRKKMDRAGHTSRMTDKRWTQSKTEWRPMDDKRTRGRPMKRWRDEIVTYWQTAAWNRHAQNRQKWKRHVVAVIQYVD